MAELKRMSLVKPSLQTPYHIDFEWWKQVDRDWRVYLKSYLCPEHMEVYSNLDVGAMIDWVDPNTAEIQQVDGIQHALITHCAKQRYFITEQTTLVDSVFRLFLANGNTPLTPLQMADALGRQPDVIVRTLSGGRVYKGIRPYIN